MDKSLEDSGTKAYQKWLTNMTAANPGLPPPTSINPPHQNEPTIPSAKADDGGPGGGGNGGKGGGSGGSGSGKGSDSSDEEPFFTRGDKKIGMYFLLFFVAIGLYIFANKLVADFNSSRLDQSQATANSAPASSKSAADTSPSTITDSKTVVYGSMFNCSTSEERDVGIANAYVQQLNADSSLHLTSGCALFQVETAVKMFSAKKYQLLVAMEEIPANNYRNDVYPGKYYKCGDTEGSMETVSLCREFLDKHRGRPVFVLIKNGGFANIN